MINQVTCPKPGEGEGLTAGRAWACLCKTPRWDGGRGALGGDPQGLLRHGRMTLLEAVKPSDLSFQATVFYTLQVGTSNWETPHKCHSLEAHLWK